MSNRRKLRGKDWAPLASAIRSIPGVRLAAAATACAPGYLDQVQAAEAEAHGIHAASLRRAQAMGLGFRPAAAAPYPDARDELNGLYLRVITELAKGELDHCEHVSLSSPRPAIACVYAGWIDCVPCARRRVGEPAALSEREEHTCDLCGTWRPGQTMYPVNAAVGPVMLIAGLCRDCLARLGAAPDDR
jgi:hypothetical protein